MTTPPPTPGAALFFYPPPYRYNDDHLLNSIQAVSVSQVTDLVPAVSFMSGIALVVDWSSICPTAGACDFSLIDRALAYWTARNKKIILSVATISYPFMSAPDGKHVQNATPDWVLAQVKTYPVSTLIMGTNPLGKTAVSQFPDFRDPKFLQLTSALVRDLAQRYDGNPTIAQVRIGTGLLGEENPMVGGIPGHTTMPNFQETQWLAFCLETVRQYQSAFHKSELEFDISRLGFIRTLGTATDQAAADAFFSELAASRLFIECNCLEAHDDDLLSGATNPPTYAELPAVQADAIEVDLRYLLGYRRSGGRVGLESGSLANPRIGTADLRNVAKIQHVVSIFQPAKLVFFDDLAQGIVSPNTSPFHPLELVRGLGIQPSP
ncbi:beta-galactosidase [Mycobacterium interjectum]|uniref:beta-galactosidase n=1 Tax=Mycobacterium interjectum TaxID=33895 RepID=UPI000B085496|nr:beta-galactosidase [Mycobacterium interjectum]MCV7090825.1 beta-galactosidase [Mycobacterium interjectum]